MFQPVSRLLQPGVRFLRIPLPPVPTAFLAVRLPLPAALWAYPVPQVDAWPDETGCSIDRSLPGHAGPATVQYEAPGTT